MSDQTKRIFENSFHRPLNKSGLAGIPGRSPMLEYYDRMRYGNDRQSACFIIHEYFRMFSYKYSEELLQFMLTTIIKPGNTDLSSQQRGSMIFFYEYNIIFTQAVHFLHEEQIIEEHKKDV